MSDQIEDAYVVYLALPAYGVGIPTPKILVDGVPTVVPPGLRATEGDLIIVRRQRGKTSTKECHSTPQQRRLFELPPVARAKRRVMMHWIDGGPGPGDSGSIWLFKCGRCQHTSEWTSATDTEARRGLPCPKCNE